MQHYDESKNKYANNSKLLFTDTDSLIYEIKTEDAYEDFSKDKEMFDLVFIHLNQKIMTIQTNYSNKLNSWYRY